MVPIIKKKYVVSFLLCGLCLFLGYLIAGALGETMNDGVPFGTAVLSVFASPLANHFNDFTPVILLLGFILYESVWFFVYFRTSYLKVNKEEPEKQNEEKPVSEAFEPKSESVTEDKNTPVADIDISDFGFVVPDDIMRATGNVVIDSVTDKEKKDDIDDNLESDYSMPKTKNIRNNDADELPDEILSFSSDVFWELNGEYTTEQIREMVKLKKYITDIDAAALKKTFKTSLSADEIREYIELFYG